MAHVITFNLLIGSTILVFIFSILLTSSISFALGYSISGIEIFLATCISLAFDWWGVNRYFKEHKLKTFGILCSSVLIIFLSSMYVSGRYFDLSCDGQTYHQEAIIQLANGWNPFYDNLAPEVHPMYIVINSYAKGAWVPAAALYKITDRIELSKAFNLLLIFASLFISFSAGLSFNQIKAKTAAILSILLSFNPVSVYQSLSFYVDGQLSSMLVSLGSLAFLLFSRYDKVVMLVIALNIIMVLNVKFTGVVYALIFVLGLVSYLFFSGKAKSGSRVVILSVISILVGIFLIGYSPYITNTLRHGNPFYPLAGSKPIDIMTDNMPANFLAKNRFEKLFLSVFSQSENAIKPTATRLKWPFTLSSNELNTFGYPDTRVGGWGPLFGGAIIVSMVILLTGLALEFSKAKIATGVCLLIMISVVVNPEAWWARYAPQFWIIPAIVLIYSKHTQRPLAKHLGCVLVLVLMINVLLVSIYYLRLQVPINALLKQQLMTVTKQQGQVLLNFGYFRSNRVRFNELGIKYKEIREFECTKYIQLISSNAKICIEKP